MTAKKPADAAGRPALADGIVQGIGAYLLWGLLPLHFHFLLNVDPFEIVAWRVLFSLALLVPIMGLRGTLGDFWALLRSGGAWPLAGSGLCIIVNWGVYVWAVQNGHVLAASLGYFLNPLVNVLLGRVVLGEKLNRVQALAVAIAAIGVALLGIGAGRSLWISIALAFSFGFYGLIRKMAAARPMQGLAVETLLLSPIALGLIVLHWAHGSFGLDDGARTALLLAATGITTSIPLLLFAAAARRLTLTTLGIIQYLAPTMQFILGILFFGESLVPAQLMSFALIWLGLIVFTLDAVIRGGGQAADALASTPVKR